jgi:hypothetical protein
MRFQGGEQYREIKEAVRSWFDVDHNKVTIRIKIS